MLVDVLTSAASWNDVHPLLSYQVPTELESEIQIGQLVAVPYGERLAEGIIWELRAPEPGSEDEEYFYETDVQDGTATATPLRPLRSILDPIPALLPHQLALAEWLAEYYATPLAQVAQLMLPPGLMQRSQVVLRLVTENIAELEEKLAEVEQSESLHTRALIGMLLADGDLNVERLKEMLGPTRAKVVLKEVRQSGVITQESELALPKARARMKKVVRLAARGTELEQWRRRTQERLEQRFREVERGPIALAPDNVRRRPGGDTKSVGSSALAAWAVPASAATLMLTDLDKDGLAAQRQLAAIDLLLYDKQQQSHWTPNALCKASSLTQNQLKKLVQERVVVIEEVEVRRDPLAGRNIPASTPLTLTQGQQEALTRILEGVTPEAQANTKAEQAGPLPILLYGVTGSGKTEVYLQALAAVIAQGKRGIVLVPEIALTTQAVQRVAGRFPERVAIIHSELSMGERYDEWRRIRAGEVDVVIGSRSALFAPLPNLGLIIIDEEHEPAYKQAERRPTYHAREAAVVLGQILRIPVVLGSATPSLETFQRAVEQRRYQMVELPARIGSQLPPVEIVDLRAELHAGHTSIISRRLYEELEQTLQKGQQAILFLNRRGAANCILCRDCGYVASCEDCDVPLTYHSTERLLICHYCGKQNKVLHFCPNCKSSSIRYFGLGTEKVQETIQKSFPEARLLRWDRDTARTRHAHEQLLDRFASREADILIGTQMIAKGLDLPGVTLVGVVSADIALNIPDFSASERSFTLLTQVAGRAGRGEEPGRVIIQTFNPLHFCIDAASRHDYREFYTAEIEARRRYGYPPFRQFVKFTYSHENRQRSQNEALLLCERLTDWIERLKLSNTDIVGPAPALMERVRGKYRWQLIVRGPDLGQLMRVIEAPGWEVDIDPVSTM